jgi:hypothetical protein
MEVSFIVKIRIWFFVFALDETNVQKFLIKFTNMSPKQ